MVVCVALEVWEVALLFLVLFGEFSFMFLVVSVTFFNLVSSYPLPYLLNYVILTFLHVILIPYLVNSDTIFSLVGSDI